MQLPILCLPQGPVASPASAFSVLSAGPGLPPPPPPPPPPGPPPLFENEGTKEASSPSRSALFAQLNQGEAITKGECSRPGLASGPGTQISQGSSPVPEAQKGGAAGNTGACLRALLVQMWNRSRCPGTWFFITYSTTSPFQHPVRQHHPLKPKHPEQVE